MYLQKLEIQGFKSFAGRTILEFPSANGKGKGITAVVGPNGSGKSNIADAIRWVLGEQSMKTLRGKKSEDVIFFGSDRKARMGMAEVSLYLNNEDGSAAIDYSELVITRRLYRDGESEYLLNKTKVRLADIQILLAKANFGQRTYSVIGQGMVDHFLVASQAERKEFFDEAAGVKEYQIKKDQTISRLEKTEDNLKQTEITLGELGPRYRSLGRMVKRLEKREEVEQELHGLQKQYYGALYFEISHQWKNYHEQFLTLNKKIEIEQKEIAAIQRQLDSLEQEESGQEIFAALQKKFSATLDKKNALREKQLSLQHKINVAKQEAKREFIPISATEMAREIEALLDLHSQLLDHLDQITELSHLGHAKEKTTTVIDRLKKLLKKVKQPNEEEIEIDDELIKTLELVNSEIDAIEKELQTVQTEITDHNKSQEQKKGKFFELQRQFSGKQTEINTISIELNDIKVELAKLETRKEDLENEIEREVAVEELRTEIRNQGTELPKSEVAENYEKIQRVKHQLELIGGLDEESLKEYEEIKERFEFLQTQYDDLIKAIDSLRKVIKELDEDIHKRFDLTFKNINEKFGEYFTILFAGGRASLEKIMFEVKPKDDDDEQETENEQEVKINNKKTNVEYEYGGVDIKACPPGKKIASLNTLSGGERAMTSIALICAIIACNPSPFVVLDEVDAALDEANSERLAAILEKLAAQTQFIVVTHNRASMRRADVLYGVTMGDDGISKLLSVKLEEGEQWAK
ncbi:MAG: AAA family ATPase [Patescibacteria group bacterium]|jgi:chromosome segregation protein